MGNYYYYDKMITFRLIIILRILLVFNTSYRVELATFILKLRKFLSSSLSVWMGVGNNFIAVKTGPMRRPLYTDPCPPVLMAPRFSSPSVIVNTLLIGRSACFFYINNILQTKVHLIRALCCMSSAKIWAVL